MDTILKTPAYHYHQKRRRYKGFLNPIQSHTHLQIRQYLPSPELAPFIDEHWIICWDLRGQSSYVFEIMPHSSVNLSIRSNRAWITGITDGVYRYEMKGIGAIIGSMFKPGGFYPFLQNNLSTITSREIEAAEVFTEANAAFRYSLLGLESDQAMIANMETLLLSRKPCIDPNLELVTSIFEAIKTDKYLRTVEEIAEQFAISERTLQYVFKKYVGIGPKSMLMRNRLMDAAGLAAQIEDPDWASVAIDLGYSHQSHFVNDFKKIIGKAPEQYVQYIRDICNK